MCKNRDSGLGISGSSRSAIHGQLPCCSEGKTKKDPNTSNSGFRSTQMGNRHVYLNFSWYLRPPLCLWVLNFQ